ncbi:hypothetical protein M5D96_005939 [Drosophila gunungcola]|uniref:Uncharacterized protein n=1 Tax=Drosophila gunungcola TaxID=103775 RepID=A0A9Q0BS11_9MUSC|nr:hypothetical protein M5D96_005939 [Drosophila gunungcola]
MAGQTMQPKSKEASDDQRPRMPLATVAVDVDAKKRVCKWPGCVPQTDCARFLVMGLWSKRFAGHGIKGSSPAPLPSSAIHPHDPRRVHSHLSHVSAAQGGKQQKPSTDDKRQTTTTTF